MKKSSKFIISSFIGPFIMTFFIALFILLMQFIWLYIDDMLGKGIEWYVIAELLLYATANLVQLALPLSILLSSLMTFGNLGEHYELVSFKAAGISLQRVMRPLFVVVLIISISALYFANNIMPVANLKFYSLLYDIRTQKPAIDIKPNVFYNEIDGYSIRITGKHKVGDTDMLENLMIYNHTENKGNLKLTVADSGVMSISKDKDYFLIKLFHGVDYQDTKEHTREKTYPLTRFAFEENEIRINLKGFRLDRTNEDLFRDDYRMLNLPQLKLKSDSLRGNCADRSGNFYHNIKLVYALRDTLPKEIKMQQDSGSYLSLLEKKQLYQAYNIALSGARANKGKTAAAKIELEQKKRSLVLMESEWHKRIALSVACIIMFFIGAPLGAIVRKGGLGMPVVVSVVFFLLFWILTISGENMAKEMVLAPYQGMWLSTAVLLPLGMFFTYKATTDSSLFNLDAYLEFIKKLFVRKKTD